jgi:hypothetical protein
MPALTTRQEARLRLYEVANKLIDQLIPADDAVPLAGQTFLDFEKSAEAINKLKCAAVEERVKLSACAKVEGAGVCPFCESAKTRLRNEERHGEALSPSGAIQYHKQAARCDACDRTFSPSAQRFRAAGRGPADAAGVRTGLSRKRTMPV